MNELFEILAEGAILEAEIVDSYLGVNIDEGVINKYISDKTGVIIDTIKKLYNKVLSVIDQVINVFSTIKDIHGLNYSYNIIHKKKITPDPAKTYIIDHEYINLKELEKAVDEALEYFINDFYILDDKNMYLGKSEYEEKRFKDIEKDYFSKITNKNVNISKLSDINDETTKIFVKPKIKIIVDSDKFEEVRQFTGMYYGAGLDMVTTLKNLKVSTKTLYRKILVEIGNSTRSLKNRTGSVDEYKQTSTTRAKFNFTLYVTLIMSLLGVVKKGISYANAVAKVISKDQTSKTKKDEEAKKEEKTEESSLDATLNLIEAAIAESELDVK